MQRIKIASSIIVALALGIDGSRSAHAHPHPFTGTRGTAVVQLYDMPPKLDGREAAAYSALREGRETPENLLTAALYASGVAPADIDRYATKARAQYDALAKTLPDGDLPTRGRALLQKMHGTVLREYLAEQTYVHGVLDNGYFNCVSSAALYNVFAGWLQAEVGGVLAPNHAYSWFAAPTRKIPVQTTAAAGFDYRGTPEDYAAFLRERKLGEGKGEPELVPSRVLVATILTNRLAMNHDNGGGDVDERAVVQTLAIGKRVLLLAPEHRLYRGFYATSLAQLRFRLSQRGRAEDAYHVARLELQVAPSDTDEGRQARRDLGLMAEKLLAKLAEAGNWRQFDAIVAEANAALGCPARREECAAFAAQVAGGLDGAALKLAGAGKTAAGWDRSWRAVWVAPPADRDAARIVHNFSYLTTLAVSALAESGNVDGYLGLAGLLADANWCARRAAACTAGRHALAMSGSAQGPVVAKAGGDANAVRWSLAAYQAADTSDPERASIADNVLVLIQNCAERAFLAGQRDAAETLVTDALARTSAVPLWSKSAAAVLGRLGWLWFDHDRARALLWLGRALDVDATERTARYNYQSAAHNHVNALVQQHRCAEAVAVAKEAQRRGLAGPATVETAGACR